MRHLFCIGQVKAESYRLTIGFLIVPEHEHYAANCLAVNETIFIPSGFPLTKSLIEGAGFSPVELENSEFKKGDGALTCLSILF